MTPEALAAAAACLAALLGVLVRLFYVARQRSLATASKWAEPKDYDVIVCGAAIAGPAAAVALAKQGRKVLVVEACLSRPDRIVGELLQPGGIAALRELGLEGCVGGIGVPCTGYATEFDGSWVELPYEKAVEGRSFHFGDFVMNLRKAMTDLKPPKGGSITVLEGAVTDIVKDRSGQHVHGIVMRPSTPDFAPQRTYTAHLVVMSDGGYSKFRPKPLRVAPHSYFAGVVLKGAELPYETKGHVVLARDGPILSYRLDPNEVRILADYHSTSLRPPSTKTLVEYLRSTVKPQLPPAMREPLEAELQAAEAGKAGTVRCQGLLRFTPQFPRCRGLVGIGDHGNMRHALTGGGMTVALNDAVALGRALEGLSLDEHAAVHAALLTFLRHRPAHSSVINLLSWALHGVFRGPMSMRRACFAYFQLGGRCVKDPMGFLAGLSSNIVWLVLHYFAVIFYGMYLVVLQGGTAFGWATALVSPHRWVQALYLLVVAVKTVAVPLWVEMAALSRFVDRTVWRF